MVSNIFYFHPYLGKIPNSTHIFQKGWNHQPEMYIANYIWQRQELQDKLVKGSSEAEAENCPISTLLTPED